MNHNKAQNHGLLILLATSFLTMSIASCWSPFRVIKYHLCMMNELPTDTLSLICDRSVGLEPSNGDSLLIPPHSSYNWSFFPATWIALGPRSYYCVAGYGSRFAASFRAFIDKPWFVDGKCQGRHCIWKYNETGIYLFHIHRYEYEFMLSWNVTSV